MNNLDIIEMIQLSETAYFYKKKKTNSHFSNAQINELVKIASKHKLKNYLLREINLIQKIGSETIKYSICVFKKVTKPTFLTDNIDGWEEIGLSYLVLADYKDYVFIIKYKIANINSFIDRHLEQIDYSKLSTLFVSDNTLFEKFTMQNKSLSKDAIKNKSYEAVDLKKSVSNLGLSAYIPRTMRIRNNDKKTSISFSTAKVYDYGQKAKIDKLLEWGLHVIKSAREHAPKDSYLDVFSTPVKWEDFKDKLIPSAIMFDLSDLHTILENEEIKITIKQENGMDILVDSKECLSIFEDVYEIEKREIDSKEKFFIKGILDDRIEIKILKNSIKLSYESNAPILEYQDNSHESIIEYFNRTNNYKISFDSLKFIYTLKELFADNNLPERIDSFLSIFIPCKALNNTVDEKKMHLSGKIHKFSNDSLFGYIEKELVPESDYAILDDLGNEWADYILLSNNKIQFVHAKHKNTKYSASSFQDIVGQVLKNIGNMTPSKDIIEKKGKDIWTKKYKLQSQKTQINRLRRGQSLNSAIDYFKHLVDNPNLIREMVLVVDFISLSDLKRWLPMIKDNTFFPEKNQVIQLFWLISCVMSACIEAGVYVKVYCKE